MQLQPRFRDRRTAGKQLGLLMLSEEIEPNPLVLALPRGGVPVGYELALLLEAELDVIVVRKLGVPGQEELAMGAVAGGGVQVLNDDIVELLNIPTSALHEVMDRETKEIQRQEALYREGRQGATIAGRTVILTDDGLATGATMLAGARAVRLRRPRQIIAAVPVASRQACNDFRQLVDRTICLSTPEPFFSVGTWYEDFAQTSDAEVQQLLRANLRALATLHAGS